MGSLSYFDICILAFSLSFAVGAMLILTRRWHQNLTTRQADTGAVQAAHRAPTPRIGGLGVLLGVVVALLLLANGQLGRALAISVLPVFVIGLAEDLDYRVSPRGRLFAAAASAALAMILLQSWIPRAQIPGLDLLVAITPLAILLTAIWSAGMCHAFNLIDGVNGLAGFNGVFMAFGLGLIAQQAGLSGLALTSYVLIPAIGGFLVLNWPWGKLFLGDAGAYSLGHILAWLGVLIAVRAETVAVPALMLVFFWPVADTVLAIYRRYRSGRPAHRPDRLHFHQLVMRGLEITFDLRGRRDLTNPLTTLVLAPLFALPVLAGVLLWNSPGAALGAMVLAGAAFVSIYLLGMKYACGKARLRGRGRVPLEDQRPVRS